LPIADCRLPIPPAWFVEVKLQRVRSVIGLGRSARAIEEEREQVIPAELMARVRAIEIRARRLVNTLFLGEYHAVFRGQGIEFDE